MYAARRTPQPRTAHAINARNPARYRFAPVAGFLLPENGAVSRPNDSEPTTDACIPVAGFARQIDAHGTAPKNFFGTYLNSAFCTRTILLWVPAWHRIDGTDLTLAIVIRYAARIEKNNGR